MNHIRKALEGLPGNWTKFGATTDFEKRCGLLHVSKVMTSDKYHADFSTIRDLMGKVAQEQYPERAKGSPAFAFIGFNDHPDTTEEEVVAVMEKAAVRLDEIV